MNKIFVIAILFFSVSCVSSQEEQQKSVEHQNTIQQESKKSLSENKVTYTRKSNVNYIVETSRPAKEIEQNYPHDIELKLADGSMVNSADVLKPNGKPTILLFWLTTCIPCRYEMKAISEKYASWEEEADFNLFAISTDFQKNYESFVKRVEENEWPWQSFNDWNREFRQVMPGQLNGLPQTFILDKEGKIVYHKRKYRSGDEDVLFEKVKEIAMK